MKQHPFFLALFSFILFSFILFSFQLQAQKGWDFGFYGEARLIKITVKPVNHSEINNESLIKMAHGFGFQFKKKKLSGKLSFTAQLGLERFKTKKTLGNFNTITALANDLKFQPEAYFRLGPKDDFFRPIIIIGGRTNFTLKRSVNLHAGMVSEKNDYKNNFSGNIQFGTGVSCSKSKKSALNFDLLCRVGYQIGSPKPKVEDNQPPPPVSLSWSPWSYSIQTIFMFENKN